MYICICIYIYKHIYIYVFIYVDMDVEPMFASWVQTVNMCAAAAHMVRRALVPGSIELG